MSAGQLGLTGVGGRIPAARVVLAPGEYVTAAPMAGAPSARLMVLATSPSAVEAAPHGGGLAVTVCTKGTCAAAPSKAARCATTSGYWHPIPAPATEGLF